MFLVQTTLLNKSNMVICIRNMKNKTFEPRLMGKSLMQAKCHLILAPRGVHGCQKSLHWQQHMKQPSCKLLIMWCSIFETHLDWCPSGPPEGSQICPHHAPCHSPPETGLVTRLAHAMFHINSYVMFCMSKGCTFRSWYALPTHKCTLNNVQGKPLIAMNDHALVWKGHFEWF